MFEVNRDFDDENINILSKYTYPITNNNDHFKVDGQVYFKRRNNKHGHKIFIWPRAQTSHLITKHRENYLAFN